MYTWPVLHCYPPLKQNPSLPPPSPKGKQSCFVLAINTCTLYTCTIELKISVIPPSLTHTIIVSKNDIYTITLILNPPIPSLVIICVDYDMTLIFKSTCCLECFFFKILFETHTLERLVQSDHGEVVGCHGLGFKSRSDNKPDTRTSEGYVL